MSSNKQPAAKSGDDPLLSSVVVIGLIGGTSSLDRLATGSFVKGLAIVEISGVFSLYRLRPGQDVQNLPTIVRPADYSAYNQKVWELVSLLTKTSPAGSQSGSQGAQGAQGRQGFQGDDGNIGRQGSQGFQGAAGAQGSQGSQGSAGAQGAQGAAGAQGNQGTQGSQGAAGAQGATGSQGPQGFQGATGSQGSQGGQGNQGAVGGFSLLFTFSTSTSAPSANDGTIRFNNTNPALATIVYATRKDRNGVDVSNVLLAMQYPDFIRVFEEGDPTTFRDNNVNSTTAFGNYIQLGIAGPTAGGGTFVNGSNVALGWAPTGNQGNQGTQGSQGAQGTQGSQGAQGATGGLPGFGQEGSSAGSYSLTTSFAKVTNMSDTSLPAGAQYYLAFTFGYQGATAGDALSFKLRDATAGADVAGAQADLTAAAGEVMLHAIYNAPGANTIQIFAKNGTSARGTVDGGTKEAIWLRLT